MKSQKWRNAYVVIYERDAPIEVDYVETESKGDLVLRPRDDYSKYAINVPKEIEEKIMFENEKYWQNRFLFGSEYIEFA